MGAALAFGLGRGLRRRLDCAEDPARREPMALPTIGDLDRVRVGIQSWLRNLLDDAQGLVVERSVTLLLDAHSPARGDERFVLRMVPEHSEVFAAHDLAMQVDVLRALAAEGVPVPHVVGFESDAGLLGSEFYVMEFVAGRIPPDNPPMAFGSWVTDDLDTDDRATMWRNGLEVLARIHAIDPSRHELVRLPRAATGEPLVAAELRRFDPLFEPELRASAGASVTEAWEFLCAHPPADGMRCLCWGDARVGNVIWRDNRPVAVLDWEMANLGDPRADLAWWVWIDKCTTEGLGLTLADGIPNPNSVYAQWSEMRGLPADGMEWFELFAAVRYAIILERKFREMRARDPKMGEVPNFAATFVPGLLEKARATR